MKYVVILGDGMADYPIEELQGRTPLQTAKKPYMDSLAKRGRLGLAKTVPEDMNPGSDTANLSVMGYDPHRYYSGRSPFEAASMGVDLKETDITFRCNLVTLSAAATYGEKVMLDHSAGEITSLEGAELIRGIQEGWGQKDMVFYPGISYRHLLVWREGPYRWNLTPPHDILGKKVGPYLPAGEKREVLNRMMQESTVFLEHHGVNKKRSARGLGLANSIWIWGEGKKPQLPGFYQKYGLKGSVISAVDLIRGIGICAGLDVLQVPGVTGGLNTNFKGKAEYALKALCSGQDFVYIHLEAPDECSHRNERDNKIKAIELIDEQVVKVVKEGLDQRGEAYRLMILPDHYTPLSLRTHTRDPVPFLLYENSRPLDNPHQAYDEEKAREAGLYYSEGYRLMDDFLGQA